MSKYAHAPLHGRRIRILILKPGDADAPLEADIREHDLAGQNRIPSPGYPEDNDDLFFLALSYVWGGEDKPCTILIDGKPFPITPSLDSFLRRLRQIPHLAACTCSSLSAGILPLWADAICINQEDDVEKASQIGLMPDIYESASYVLVDLDEDSDDARLASRLMEAHWKKHIWSGGIYHGKTFTAEELASLFGFELPPEAERETLRDAQLPPDEDPQWASVRRFFARPWFMRVWVVQEFVLARHPILICGDRLIPWQSIAAYTVPYVSHPGRSSDVEAVGNEEGAQPRVLMGKMTFHRMVVLKIYREARQAPWRLLSLLEEGDDPVVFARAFQQTLFVLLFAFQESKCTHDRDRYFALLALAEDLDHQDKADLRPDYRSPIRTIIIRFARYLVRTYGWAVLECTGLWRPCLNNLPSWAIDFTSPSHDPAKNMTLLTAHRATAGSRFHVTLWSRRDSLITLRGTLVDIMDSRPFTSPLEGIPMVTGPNQARQRSILRDAQRHLSLSLRALLLDPISSCSFLAAYDRHGPDEFVEAFAAVLVFGSVGYPGPVDTPPSAILLALQWVTTCAPGMKNAWAALQRRLGTEIEPTRLATLTMWFVHRMAQSVNLIPRQPAQTRKGYMASVPSMYQPRDEIWIIQGMALPVVLRKVTSTPAAIG